MSILRNISMAMLSAMAFATADASVAEDLRIGAVFGLTGPSSAYSEVYMAGTELAVAHANADKLLNGKLSIVYEDGQALPQRSVIAMTKLVNVEKAPFVLVSFSGVSKAISPIAAQSKTVAINAAGGSSELSGLGPYFWNVTPLTNIEVRALVPYLVRERKLKRFVLLYVDDPAGEAIRKEIDSSLPPIGGELVGSFSVPVNAQQFGGVAAKIREVKPDVVYIASYGAQQASMIKQLRDNGVSQQIASYSGFTIPEINALPEARGAIYTTPNVDWNSQDPVTRRFVDDFKAKYRKMPTFYSANYYNAVRLFALLAQELQKQGKPVTGASLLAQRLATRSFDFVGGKVTFAENGTVLAPPIGINVVDGNGGKPVTVIEAR